MTANLRTASLNAHILNPKQREFVLDQHRYCLYSGGVGSGKSLAGCYKAINYSLTHNKCMGIIGNQTYGQLADSTFRTFMEVINYLEAQNEGVRLIKSFDKSKLNMTLINGSEILFRSYDKEGKIRGSDINFFYLDEASTIKEDIYNQLLNRLRKGETQQAWLTTNPDTTGHWIYKRYIENPFPPEQYNVIYTSSKDNTSLPDDYLKSFNYYDEDYRRRFVEGQWGIIEGLVYKEFNEALHIKALPLDNRWKSFYRGIDYGFTNPFVCLFVAIDADSNIYVFDEYYNSKILLENNVNNVCNMHNNIHYTATYIDPSSPETIERFKHKGQRTVPADNEVEQGIQSVMRKLHKKENGEPSLYINPKCKNLIRELHSYKRVADKKTGIDNEEPVKMDDHTCDALRYVIHTLFSNKGKIKLRKDIRVFY